MSHLDRYIFKQCLLVFAFFTLVFSLVTWVNRSVFIFDSLISAGHSATVFLEFSLLALPTVLSAVLPISAFAATTYVTSRLSNESELAVIQATGISPWRLARPVFVFGLLIGFLMFSLTGYLVPKTGTTTKDREFELSQNLGAKFLREGSFQHPLKGVTFFISDITQNSELRGVLISDRREKDTSYTYTSERAFLVSSEDQTILLMQNGMLQSLDRINNTLSLTQFDELAYNLAIIDSSARKAPPPIDYLPTLLLWQDPELASDLTNQPLSRVTEDKHRRIQYALLCLVTSLLGFAALYSAGFSRHGSGLFIGLAIFLLVIVKLFETVATEPARANSDYWYLVYAPSVVGLLMFWTLIYFSMHSLVSRKNKKFSEQHR